MSSRSRRVIGLPGLGTILGGGLSLCLLFALPARLSAQAISFRTEATERPAAEAPVASLLSATQDVALPISLGAPASASNLATASQTTQSASVLDPYPIQLPRPQFGLRLLGFYDDNVYGVAHSPRLGDFVLELTPSIGWNSAGLTGAANSVQIIYAPTIQLYVSQDQNDTVNQAGNLIYVYDSGKTRLTFRQNVDTSQEASADFGGLVKTSAYATQLDLVEQLTTKVSLEAIAQQVVTSDNPGYQTTEWTGSAYLDYQVLPKTSVGFGTLVGKADIPGPNQTYEQANLRAIYDPDPKLSLNALAGAEFRETQGQDGLLATPDFSLGSAWEPVDGTDLGLNAYRREDYSGKFFAQDYLATGVSGYASQRFLQRAAFTTAATFEHADYQDNITQTDAHQSYDYYSVRPSLTITLTDRCDLSLFYEYRESISQSSPFTDNQTGFSVRFIY